MMILSGASLNRLRRSTPDPNQRFINTASPNRQSILAANQKLLDHGQFTPLHAQARGRDVGIEE